MTETVNLLSRNTPENSGLNPSFEAIKISPTIRQAMDWNDMVATVEADDVEIVLWRRSEYASLSVADTTPESEFEIIIGEQRDIHARFAEAFEASDWPASLHDIVEQDVQAFIKAFEARVAGSNYRLRLQAISDDACRRFHQDRTFQRLIITYRGLGTVWRHMDEATEYDAIEMECVLLRGKRNGRDTQILHKSPIFPTGHPSRLIMVIDVMPKGFAP